MDAPVADLAVTPELRLPQPPLRSLVDDYLGCREPLADPGVHRGLLSSVVTVVVPFDEPLDVSWLSDPTSRDRLWAQASGLHTSPAEIQRDGLQFGIPSGLTTAGARHLPGTPKATLEEMAGSSHD